MKKSQRGEYVVFEWRDELQSLHMEQLLSRYPSIVEGLYVVISSWDSGTYQPTEEQIDSGWQLHGRMAHSPRIANWRSLPFELYDEWYIFDHQITVAHLEPLVNYLGFSPVEFGWLEKTELFWNQVARYRPVHVIGDGQHLFLVTRDERIIASLAIRILQSLPKPRGAHIVAFHERTLAARFRAG